MPFGISFGAKKGSVKTNTAIDKTEDVTGNQSTATSGVSAGSTTQSSTGESYTSGSSSQQQNTNQQQSGTETGRQTGSTTTLGSDVQDALSGAVKKLLAGGVSDANIAAISNMIGGATGFNADQFVKDTVLSARTKGEETLQEQQSSAESAIGGTAATNSMAALLHMRGRNDLESSLAGVRANATATAEDIRNKNLSTAVGAEGSLAGQAEALGSTLKGGTTTVDMTTLSEQLQSLLGTTGTTGETTGHTTESSQQNTQTMQLISQLVDALTNQSTHTVGTEDTKQKSKSMGGGVSAGI